MTPAEFLANFGHLADAPNGIDHLRWCIKKLAVSGGFGGKHSDWQVKSLPDVVTILDNQRKPISTSEREARNGGKSFDELYPYYGATQQTGWIDDYIFDEELVLLGEDGVPFFDPLRPKAYMVSGKCWVNNHAHVLRGELVNNDFLCIVLNVADYHDLITGTTRLKLNQKKMKGIMVPLPPKAEQHRIVAKVDELMALCDELEQRRDTATKTRRQFQVAALDRLTNAETADELDGAWARVRDNFGAVGADLDGVKSLRQAILQLAVRGRLVAQDPDDEPVSAWVHQRHALPDGYKRLRKTKFGRNVDLRDYHFPLLPETWTYASVQELYDNGILLEYADGNHGSLYPRKGEFGTEGEIFITAQQIKNGIVDLENAPRLATEKARQLRKGWAKGGDVLFTHNATVGRTACVPLGAKEFLLGTSVTFYRLNAEHIDPSYLFYSFSSDIWQGQARSIMEQTTRNQVSIQKQAQFRLPIAPPSEQRRIVAKIDELMTICDQLEQHLHQAETTATRYAEAACASLTEVGAAA